MYGGVISKNMSRVYGAEEQGLRNEKNGLKKAVLRAAPSHILFPNVTILVHKN